MPRNADHERGSRRIRSKMGAWTSLGIDHSNRWVSSKIGAVLVTVLIPLDLERSRGSTVAIVAFVYFACLYGFYLFAWERFQARGMRAQRVVVGAAAVPMVLFLTAATFSHMRLVHWLAITIAFLTAVILTGLLVDRWRKTTRHPSPGPGGPHD